MKETKFPRGRNRVRVTQLILLVVCAVVTTGYACQFWAITTNSTVANFTPYTVCADSLAQLARQYSPVSNDGWGITYYDDAQDACVVYRSDSTIYNGTQSRWEYQNQYNQAANAGAYGVMVHARAGTPLIDDPHPFVYSLMGNNWSFQHNGTVYSPDVVEDNIGAGFCALDIFHARTYTIWHPWNPAGSKKRIDSEYYGMQLMKDYLIAQNYYTTAPVSMTPMEWALNHTEYKIAAITTYSSLNAAVTNGQDIWQVRKSDASHTVSYWPITTTADGVRMITTRHRWDSPSGVAWHEMSQNKYVKLNPYEDIWDDGSDTFQKALQTMSGSYETPLELRINGSDYASGSQIKPAVSADPVHGTFVAVWEDANSGRIKARWYDQMGLAEASEFFVDLGTLNHSRSAPAIAHHPGGDRITIVWLDRPSGSLVYNKVMSRTFTWSQTDRSWMPVGTTETQINVTNPIGFGFGNPAVTYSANDSSTDGIWAATWDGTNGNIYSHVSTWASTQELIYSPGADSGRYFSNPDICYWGCVDRDCADDRFKVVFVATSINAIPSPRYIRTGLIKISDPTFVDIYGEIAVGSAVSYPAPSICYSGTLSKMTGGSKVIYYSVTNSELCIASDLHSYRLGLSYLINDVYIPNSSATVNRTDIARRVDGYDICFSKTNGTNGLDIYDAFHSGTTVDNPVLVNTTTGNSDQKNPTLAVAQTFECRDGDTLNFYALHSSTQPPQVPPFAQRRLILWQSNGQPGGNSDEISGRFAGVYGAAANDRDWYYSDPTNFPAEAPLDKNDLDDIAGDEPGSDPQGGLAPTAAPAAFALASAYPNPFNPTTTIRFDVPVSSDVQIMVYDIHGRLAATLLDGYVSAGVHHALFDGSTLASGTYFVRMNAQNFSGIQKILLIK